MRRRCRKNIRSISLKGPLASARMFPCPEWRELTVGDRAKKNRVRGFFALRSPGNPDARRTFQDDAEAQGIEAESLTHRSPGCTLPSIPISGQRAAAVALELIVGVHRHRPVGTTDVRRGLQPPFYRHLSVVSRSDTSQANRAHTPFNRRDATGSRARIVRGINPTANPAQRDPYGTGPVGPIAKVGILGRAPAPRKIPGSPVRTRVPHPYNWSWMGSNSIAPAMKRLNQLVSGSRFHERGSPSTVVSHISPPLFPAVTR